MPGPWEIVADLLGFGDPSGNDHGSSNWVAWGHEEIRSMLDVSVDPGDIDDAARVWHDQGRDAADLVTRLTRDVNGIVSGGWRGASADAAITVLGPIDQWSASIAHTSQQTTQLMDASGFSAGQAKATVPPPKPHDWGQSLRSFTSGGLIGAAVDAVAQERTQSEAHAEAVRIMSSVYSAPINDHRTAVPTYPQLVDPTLQPPAPTSQSPGQLASTGPAPGLGYAGGGGASAGTGGHGGAHVSHSLPTAATLQGVTSGHSSPMPDGGGQAPPDQATRGPQYRGGQPAAAVAAMAAGVPIAGGSAQLARRADGQLGSGGGRATGHRAIGGGRSGAAGAAPFGPSRSGAAEAAEARVSSSAARGAHAAAAGRAGFGGMMPPITGARGKEGEDTERRRPSYLIEMDDVFTDGRKVAPPVIGEDPPEHSR